ncbi:hypothetical protein V6N12_066204 [Hibiscus sabdariffa]|uniref:RNase H type-1 domain-containing protein n=1 Tax=Hibiscus sabdariffa TaxID=183260 RepID=A0ABR2B945_9ROSI
MVIADGVWKWEAFSHVLPPHVLLHIVAISPPLPSFPSASIAWTCEASDSFSIRSAYKLFLGEISGDEDLMLLCRNWEVRVLHVLRRDNSVADRLAKLANPDSTCVMYFEDPPPSIVHILQRDVASISVTHDSFYV